MVDKKNDRSTLETPDAGRFRCASESRISHQLLHRRT
jgi:hypothetical protein